MANQPVEKTWSWRDSGKLGLGLQLLNAVGELTRFKKNVFNPDSLIDKATRLTGYEDFGSDSFRKGLEVICESYSTEANFNTLGRIAAEQALVNLLAHRLNLVEWEKQHPEVHQQQIRTPWIVTGLPRSGTSLMSTLLDLDNNIRSPTVWETQYPIPPATLANRYSDPRIRKTAKTLAQVEKLAPCLPAIHNMEPMVTQECLLITNLDFRSLFFESLALCPTYGKWYVTESMQSAYELHKRLLKIWQNEIPTRYWALKAPNHMHGIDDLLAVYPDARMIWMHRDPAVCISSITSLMLAMEKPFNKSIDPVVGGAHFNWMYHTGIEMTMDYDARQQGNWCCHVHYHDFMADPEGTMERVYTHFNEELMPDHLERLKAWIRQRPKNTFGRHVYPLEDFGLSAEKLHSQYADYISRFNVALEN